jgi:hypothetical protein
MSENVYLSQKGLNHETYQFGISRFLQTFLIFDTKSFQMRTAYEEKVWK